MSHSLSHNLSHCPSPARCVADLKWLLFSPPLLSLAAKRYSAPVQAFTLAEEYQISDFLETLDEANVAQGLADFIAKAMPAKAPMRLGRYAERLLEYFLLHNSIYHCVAANLPIRHQKSSGVDTCNPQKNSHTTAGELDFLIQDKKSGDYLHWELAVKFYLCHPPKETLNIALEIQSHHFKGPAGRDTLQLKLGKMFDRQLRHLADTETAVQVNTELGLSADTVWHPAAYARGWLFYPYQSDKIQCENLNPAHLRGWWIYAIEFAKNASFVGTHFVILPRLYWLAPYDEAHETPEIVLTILTCEEVLSELSEKWSAAAGTDRVTAGHMVAQVILNTETGWQEINRGFVLPGEFQLPDASVHFEQSSAIDYSNLRELANERTEI